MARDCRDNLNTALQTISHRGPDDSGSIFFEDHSVLLGHRRLAILELSKAGAQPMVRGPGALIYNGEIYNHKELRERWLSDCDFRGTSDSETLLVGLLKYGTEFLSHLRGMYAGAFFDRNSGEVFLFRDPLGIKPLYLCEGEHGSFVFSSEIKGIFSLQPTLLTSCNNAALYCYLSFENFPQTASLFEGIELLAPGTVTRLQCTRGIFYTRYNYPKCLDAEVEPAQGEETFTFGPEMVRDLVSSAVQSHLQSDVPVGVYMSGGIDSCLVASLAAQMSGSRIMGFTGFFEGAGPEYDERHLTRVVAEKSGILLDEISIKPQDFIANFDRLIWSLDEPRMGMGSFPQFIVAANAAAHRKVILSGHGGDELFGGYRMHKAFNLMSQLRSGNLNAALRQMTLRDLPWAVYTAGTGLTTGRIPFAPTLALRRAISSKQLDFFATRNLECILTQLDHYYLQTYLPGLLVVEDKISMAHSLETRVPLWSDNLVKAITSVQMERKMIGGVPKGLLKLAFHDLIPGPILSAPKRGFPTPLRHWFRGPLREYTRDALLARDSPVHRIYQPKRISRLLHFHNRFPLPGPLDERRAHTIWQLLCLESWMRQFKVQLADTFH